MRCSGCLAPELQPFRGGLAMDTGELSRLVLSLGAIDGITFSGGEPFCQAAAISEVIDQVRSVRDMSAMSYTGYTLGDITARADPSELELLSRLDMLIDGPYVRELHTDLIWRGSSNQEVHFLTDRYAVGSCNVDQRGTWLEFDIDARGGLFWTGIPPIDFRNRLRSGLAQKGLLLDETPVIDEGRKREAGR